MEKGVWRTIGGRRVFIKDGQDLSTAMRESGKFTKNKKDDKIGNNHSEKYEEYKTKDSEGNEIVTHFKKDTPDNFKKVLDEAKMSNPAHIRWRVDNTSHSVADYKKDKLFTTKKGSSVAITPDGDIISVCSNRKNKDSGRALMEYAVKNGGKKLDSYDGNYGFYTKMGFEPVSWIYFDKQFAPDDWVEGRDKEEPIIFFKYTGKQTAMTKEEFYKKVKADTDYDEAMKKRDKEVK